MYVFKCKKKNVKKLKTINYTETNKKKLQYTRVSNFIVNRENDSRASQHFDSSRSYMNAVLSITKKLFLLAKIFKSK